MDQPQGTRIGRYEIVTLLGQGGMARVYLALARGPVGFNKLVVVKQIRPELAWDDEFLNMFLEEARIAARLNHPNVVSTLEVLESDGEYAIAMEFLEGQTLAELLKRMGRSKMPIEEHLWVLTQVLAGLHYGHELRDFDGTPIGVIHRDVSPSNVFLTCNGEVKLLDFGIAKATGAVSVTNKGTVKGKLGYGAPEQFLSNPVDARTDVFSVGVMIWEALAGQRRKPAAETAAGIFQARVAGWEPGIAEVRPDVPPALREICDRATAVNPEDRYACAADLQHELERYLESCARRVGRREVAGLVSYYFEAERAEIRRRIEGQLNGAAASVTPGATMEAYVSQSSIRPRRRPLISERKQQFVGAALLGAAAVMGALMVRAAVRRSEPVVVVVPPALPEPGPAAPVGPAPSGTGPAARGVAMRSAPGGAPVPAVGGRVGAAAALAPRPAPVAPGQALAAAGAARSGPAARRGRGAPSDSAAQLVVRANPPEAVMTLDGVKLTSNPYHAAVPRDGKVHVLRASAAGFEPVERRLVFAQDLEIDVTLTRSAAPAAPARPAVVERAARGDRRSRAGSRPPRPEERFEEPAERPSIARSLGPPSRAASIAPPAVNVPNAPALEPGVDLQRTARPQTRRQIDEKDPYGQ